MPSDLRSVLNDMDNFHHPPLSMPSQRRELSEYDNAGSNSSQVMAEVKRRGGSWLPWEDRNLAKEVLARDPITNRAGKKEDRWKEVADNLLMVGMHRTWSSCKDHMGKLIQWHRNEQSMARQATGTNEEVSEYVEIMDNIILLADSVSIDLEIRKNAKAKLQKKKDQGFEIRRASMHGLVRKRDMGTTESEVESPHPRKRAKNLESLEMEKVLKDIDDGTERFEQELLKKERKEEERNTGLCERLDKLVGVIQQQREESREQNIMMQNMMEYLLRKEEKESASKC
ncbi:hypothetical protein DFP73DRAFT_619264 [Morchella snyderi]|nr:hypothetical protein DFP73DRAFT_619264 [Morchella snyderi]